MPVVLVHGVPETAEIWNELRERLPASVALRLPGFGSRRPAGFGGTKEDYAAWLADELRRIEGPIDLVGHDWLRKPGPEPGSIADGLRRPGCPAPLAAVAAQFDETTTGSILDLYRSAVPNVSRDWGDAATRPTVARGLVLIPTSDPFNDFEASVRVAATVGAATAPLRGLRHCWMAEAPQAAADALMSFWSAG
jgi:pimeloyl-ACP methyl ester carboxylesterase